MGKERNEDEQEEDNRKRKREREMKTSKERIIRKRRKEREGEKMLMTTTVRLCFPLFMTPLRVLEEEGESGKTKTELFENLENP